MQHLDLAPEIMFPRCSGLGSQTAVVTSFSFITSSLHAFPTQTDSSEQICACPVLSAPLELNKHLIINGHRALDRRPAFVARECARTDSAGWGGKLVTPAVSALLCLDDASSVIFNYPQSSFHWRTLPSLSEYFQVWPCLCTLLENMNKTGDVQYKWNRIWHFFLCPKDWNNKSIKSQPFSKNVPRVLFHPLESKPSEILNPSF